MPTMTHPDPVEQTRTQQVIDPELAGGEVTGGVDTAR